MILNHGNSFFNPFDIDGRYLKNIHFYTPEGIKFSSSRGWLDKGKSGRSNNEFGSLLIPGELIYKRAPINFAKASGAFLVKVKADSWDAKSGIKNAELYIPYNPSEWTIEEERTNYNPNYIYVTDIYIHKDGYSVRVPKESVPIPENIEYEADIKVLLELTGKYQTDIHSNRKAILAKIRELAEKYGLE